MIIGENTVLTNQGLMSRWIIFNPHDEVKLELEMQTHFGLHRKYTTSLQNLFRRHVTYFDINEPLT